jgi:hypothetical protein
VPLFFSQGKDLTSLQEASINKITLNPYGKAVIIPSETNKKKEAP